MSTKPPMNHMGAGMWPLNWCVRFSKLGVDLMFHVSMCDRASVLADLELIEKTIKDFRQSLSRVQ